MLLQFPHIHQGPKLEDMIMNFPGKGSPSPSPTNFQQSDVSITSVERKRLAEEVSTANAINDRPNKRPFIRRQTSMTAAIEEKLGSPMHQGFPLRNNLVSKALLGHQAQRLAGYQSSLGGSSLASRQVELAERQLRSRYFSPQLRLSGLTTSLAVPPSLGLGTLVGHQVPGAVAAPGSSLASFLGMPQVAPLQPVSARFQQPGTALGSREAYLPFPSGVGSQHRSDRLPDAMICSSISPSMTRPAHAGLPELGGNQEDGSPIPLGIEEDPNWLSDFHVFVRKNLVELCWASSEDVALRNPSNRVTSHQVGIRCRCCAHLNPSARAQRSSAFPSSIAQIYQSFTMMLRAHFSSCTEVPPALKEKFLALKSKTTQGATDSKQYWIYSARRLGMVDSDDGIVMTKSTTSAARTIPPFGTDPATGRGGEESSPFPLVAPSDRAVASDFLYTLLLQGRRVRLQANEQRGNKKSLQLGLPGFACRHCCQLGRMGQCRIFPARRRTLPTKIYDLYEHLMKCNATPNETKELLEVLHERENYQAKMPGQKDLLDLIWSRLAEQHA